jgi:S-formylglutathione hydrolase FrmB
MKKLAAIILVVISLFYLATEVEAQSDGKPSVPTNVQASDGTYMDKVQVTWTASSGATSYTVYRATSTSRWVTKVVIGSTSNTSYDDTTASVGRSYYYWVKASNSYGTSAYSAYDKGYRSDGRPPVPTNVQASDGTYMDKVQVTWTASPGATSYTVYRATLQWGTKTALGTTSETTYDDTTALAGKIYYYYIKATNANGMSNFSVYDTGWWRGPIGKGSPQFRAIGGVSMGAYGAMNIGLGRPSFFNTIASLGGPLDMAYLLKFIEVDMLGDYDNPDLYPNRDTLIDMLKDLTISFGNPVYYNPLSTYYPPGINAQNARVPTTLPNFKDRLNPDGNLPVITYEDPDPGDWVEVLLARDDNENERRNLGEPILRQFQEPFTDNNLNGIFEPGLGETYSDTGLDGVPNTADYGENDGVFTYNPNHNNYFAEDPLSRAETLPLTDLQPLNLYIDAGTEDEFQFNIHAENFVDTLQARLGPLSVRIENDFPENFPGISHFDEKMVYVRYPGGHVGFDEEDIGLSFEQAKQGIEGAIVVANRFTTLFSFVSDHFIGGDFGTGPYELYRYPSEIGVVYFNSPSLNRRMKFGIYLPPGYSRSSTNYYPVLYLLLGYNMSVEGMANSWIKAVLDGFILTGEMQKMIIVIPDGLNYKNQNGHFFVNQIDPERGDNFKDYFFDLVTFIDRYYKTR